MEHISGEQGKPRMQNRRDGWPTHLSPDTSLPLSSNIRQIDILQLLRAVAVILVVWCHACQILTDVGAGYLPSFGVFGIDIFFVISGFILSLSVLRERSQPGVQPMWEFMKRRFIRIYPIYWVIAGLTLARLARSHQLSQNSSVSAFFLLPSLRYPISPFIVAYSWTMNFEVFFYLLLGLVLLKTVKRAVPLMMFILVALCSIGAIVGIRHPIVILAANPMLLEFVFGAAIALLYARIGRKPVLGIIVLAAGIAVSLCIRTIYSDSIANGMQMIMTDRGPFGRVITWGLSAALIVGGLVLWSPSMDSTLSKGWVLMGNASYSSYLISALALEFASRAFFRLAPPAQSIGYRLLYTTSMVVIVMAAGFCCYIAIEKPMLRKLQKALLHKTPGTHKPSASIRAEDLPAARTSGNHQA
jgi:exopolysaccharide production protein ExoZ